jgi:predicted DCC family thiol-disulfide oxidoreductase YuxK
MRAPHPRIIFFDGVCGLCNRFVDHLLRIDRRRAFRFAPLQGDTAKNLLAPGASGDPESVIYWRDGKALQRSEAALRILMDLGGWRKGYAALLLVPPVVRDAAYGWVARNRYRWFGKRDACRLPAPEERDRFMA